MMDKNKLLKIKASIKSIIDTLEKDDERFEIELEDAYSIYSIVDKELNPPKKQINLSSRIDEIESLPVVE